MIQICWFWLTGAFGFKLQGVNPAAIAWEWHKAEKLLLFSFGVETSEERRGWSWTVANIEVLNEEVLLVGFLGGMQFKPDWASKVREYAGVIADKLFLSYYLATMRTPN